MLSKTRTSKSNNVLHALDLTVKTPRRSISVTAAVSCRIKKRSRTQTCESDRNTPTDLGAFSKIQSEIIDSADVVEAIAPRRAELVKEISESDAFPWEHGGLNRRWVRVKKEKGKFTSSSSSSSTSSEIGSSFTVCSYNVLCQETLYATAGLYKHCVPEYLAWDYRWQLLRKEFSTLDADVYCLQEVEQRYYESHFVNYFQDEGYAGSFKCRTGGKPDGCAIFWRLSRFDISFSEDIDFRVAGSILDRDNVASIVVLALKSSSSSKSTKRQTNKNKVLIANTHLLFNPARGDIKLCQVAMLLAKVQKISQQSNDTDGVILCGDFNSVPLSPLYKFVVEGRLHYVGLRRADVSGQQQKFGGPRIQYPLIPSGANLAENTCREITTQFDEDVAQSAEEPGRLGHDLNLISTYQHWTSTGDRAVSTMHSNGGTNVDYIFYKVDSKQKRRKERKLHRLRCRSLLTLPSGDEIKETVGVLPNQFCGSDHLPLLVEFEFV